MTVDGTGTDFSSLTSSLISVGSNSGTGSLTYSNNATGTHGQVRVGNVNDPDPNTSGTFNVESGASLTIDELYINNAGGLNASGEVTVTGTGSSITQTPFASANIGHTSSGTGTLTIQDSATFTTGQGTTSILPTGTLNIDLDSSGGSFQANGPVIVEGGTINKVSSALQINPGAYLLVRNGGAMFTTGGEYTDPNASYLVQEPGSLISNDNILFIVDNASYNVTLGGTLSVDTGIQMFDSSTMLVSGIGSTLDNNGSLDVGQAAGSPTATFADGATADTNGLTLATGPSPTDTINATVNVTTGATLNTGFGDILLTSNGGPFKSSTLNIQGPGSLVTQHPTAGGSIVVGDDLNGTATINIATTQSGATLTTTANGVKQFNIKATGTVNIGSPTTTGTLNNSLDFTNEGLINIAGGTLNNTASQFLNTGNGTIRGSGTIDMNINTLTNDATVSPGITTGAPTTAGVMTIADGHFTQQANGILEIEIGGTTPGSEHDVLDVGRNLTLAGTLDVSFINGYTPQIGDSFDILNWGISVFGDFDTRNLPALGAGMLWDQTNLLTDGTLAIISDALTGDLNGDGFVGIADLNIVLGAWNQSVPPADPAADPSGDNFVGIADLNTVLGNWNAGTPPNNMDTNVPEPASFTVLMIAYLCLLRHPRLQPEL
jgi:T5SS/PEP-CTERM-associated repeat protein